MENIILIDWMSFTSKIDSTSSLIETLGLTSEDIVWQENYGFHGYKNRLYFMGISIHYNGFNDDIWLEMSGEGCRAFETYSKTGWEPIFDMLVENTEEYHVTRIDIAYDDFDKKIDIQNLASETFKNNFITKFKDAEVICKVRAEALTINYGSKGSDTFFRCYDKAKERKREDIDHWVRFEVQLRDDRAIEFLKKRAECDSIGKLFFGVVNNYLRYIVPNENDKNRQRWKTAPFWSSWLEHAESISLYTPKNLDYNILHVENFVYHQAGNAVDTLLRVKGYSKFIEELQERKPNQSLKYKEILDNTKAQAEDPIISYIREHEKRSNKK